MKRALCAVLVAVIGIVVFNAVSATWPAYRAKKEDPRNNKVMLWVYHQYAVNPNVIVLDLWNLDSNATMADVDRVLFDTAAALKARSLTSVSLAFRGREKFEMKGDYFKKLGDEREWQNPVYTMRTMPENLYTPDGRPAFDTWTGGWLGVIREQMDDHNEFHRAWYIEDLT
ncbi:hypothetical protein [Sinorhizobium mexicanum]|uniref:Uncharacterized protein n=1 Tax=Sinorhizobium mexicanum TaxID=375549 RepID=A0A859QNL6_9HYPH|nr:hypothetical protein [Sinorhizobium mexicanum]MBP1885062.1 hypothetical protein [Sinorhizobium mexicanum]QLL64330.1 hypothetical protein FKV68_23110 [Sinorhizobium mexicanum]